MLEPGGLTVCGFRTTWGDGSFPVTLDLDASGRPLRLRIDFAGGAPPAAAS
ncbi:MAG: hypothetical protein SFW67_28190 [Myxococcaceae bacterium]|nr:hypothetical protein [Myxococcaceae bacterium]